MSADIVATRGTATSRASAWVAVLAVIAGLAFAPPWHVPADVPPGFLRLVEGSLERLDGQRWLAVGRGELVPTGTTVRTRDGEARLDPGDGALTLADRSVAVLDHATTLQAGALLVEIEDRSHDVHLGSLLATGRGAWRVDAGSAPRLGVYDGGATLRGPSGAGTGVDRFEEANVRAGRPATSALPLRYLTVDAWDARLLSGAIAVDRQVEQLHDALVAAYGTDPQPASFYASFLAVDDAVAQALPGFGAGGDATFGPPADVLVAVVITTTIVDRAGLTARVAVNEVRELRRDGATWGLILARHDLGAEELRAAIDLALRRREIAELTGQVGPSPTPNASPTPSPTGSVGPTETPTSPGPTGPTSSTTSPTTSPTTPPTSPPTTPTPTDDPPGPCQLDVCDPINDGVDDLTDLIDEVVPGLGDDIDEVVSEIPTILPPGGLPLG